MTQASCRFRGQAFFNFAPLSFKIFTYMHFKACFFTKRLDTTLKWCGARATRSAVDLLNVLALKIHRGKSITTTSATIVPSELVKYCHIMKIFLTLLGETL